MSAGRLFSIDGCLLTESLSFLANFSKNIETTAHSRQSQTPELILAICIDHIVDDL